MLTGIVIIISPFVLNALTALTNRITGVQSTTAKRLILAAVSLIGIVGTSAATGNPIDPSSVSSVLQVVAETFVTFLTAHGSYHLFFKSSTQAQA